MADGDKFNGGDAKEGVQRTEDRIPFSIDSERAVLGAILFDNEIYVRLSSFLKTEHFFDPVHALIFDACHALIDMGRLASPITLDAHLASSAGYKELGGRKYLEAIAASVPSTASANDYARVVFDLAVYRGLIDIGGEIVDRARRASVDDEPDQQLQDAERRLYELAETGHYGKGFKTFRAALLEAVNVADAALKRGGGLSGVATGLSDLDNMMGGLHPSDLVILAGRPSMGKTSLAVNIAVNAARAKMQAIAEGRDDDETGAVVGFFSLEMSADQIAMRILSEMAEVPSNEIRRGTIDQAQFDRIYQKTRELDALPLHIDDTGGLSIAQVAARARRLKRQKGLDLIVVDYLQLLSGSSRKGDNRVQEITEISVGLKALAKELHVPVIALSQLSRQVESREDKRPLLSDLRESGSIEQDADIVLFVYREEYYLKRSEPKGDGDDASMSHAKWLERMEQVRGIAEVIIAKQRHGPIGNVPLRFEESLTKFSDLDDGRYDALRYE
ncbi:MAG: replicative DNA helicase [Alphaproteobacteria bacterium]|nr:replicative DNA helicase [Alphaproteobacteria bacterium]